MSSNSQPGDQESCAVLTEPAGRPHSSALNGGISLRVLNGKQWKPSLAAEAEKELIEINMSDSQDSCESCRETVLEGNVP